ncbi:hypothetical protein [Streptomyces sp. NPDC059455]|uniref:hypothetical protein n=1 Tax=Streptomyces sp. NPDC059455 TaxID=3346837 RepID=UPI0036B88269
MLVLQEPAEVSDEAAGPRNAVPGGDMGDELAQPERRFGKTFTEVFTADEGAAGVLLPARRAQPQPGMPPQLPALAADPGRLFR